MYVNQAPIPEQIEINLTPLKYILYFENVTSVFRNYLCLKKSTRFFVIFWVFIEASNIALTAVDNYEPGQKLEIQCPQTYFYLSTSFSIYLLVSSLCHCKTFYKLLLNFDAFYHCCDDDGVFNQKMLKAQKVLTFKIVTLCSVLTVLFFYFRMPTSAGRMGWIVTIISTYCNSMSDIRYIFQYFVLQSILFVASEQLKAITRSIDSELSTIREKRENVEHAENLSLVTVNYDKIKKWEKAYENINYTSILCNSMFSMQLTIMLLIVTLYYIKLMYSIAILTVKGAATSSMQLMYLFLMFVFLNALLMISRAGQQIQNSYEELRQKLCELCVHSLENEEYYKLTKDLLRYVRTRPVRVHVFGTLDVNMSMLPSVVACFTTYTVIALQFNNVL